MGVTRRTNHQHDAKQKAKARKSGPSVLRKTQLLGKKGNVLSLALYEEPTHHEYRLAAHIPRGKRIPDLNAIDEYDSNERQLANYLAGRPTLIEPQTTPSSSPNSRPRTRSAYRRAAQTPTQDDTDSETEERQDLGEEVSPHCVQPGGSQTFSRSASVGSDIILSIPTVSTSILSTMMSQGSALSTPGIAEAQTYDEHTTSISHPISKIPDQGGAEETDPNHGHVYGWPWNDSAGQKMSLMDDLMEWEHESQTNTCHLNSEHRKGTTALHCSHESREPTGLSSRTVQAPNKAWRLAAEKLLHSIDTILEMAPKKSSPIKNSC